jgi:hypothetical protein
MRISDRLRQAVSRQSSTEEDERALRTKFIEEFGKLKADIKKWASALKKEGIILDEKPSVDPQHINPLLICPLWRIVDRR